jgi:hypothetical protein
MPEIHSEGAVPLIVIGAIVVVLRARAIDPSARTPTSMKTTPRFDTCRYIGRRRRGASEPCLLGVGFSKNKQ